MQDQNSTQTYNLPLLRKRLATAETQLTKLTARVEQLRNAVKTAENAQIISTVRSFNINPEALAELLHELCSTSDEQPKEDISDEETNEP